MSQEQQSFTYPEAKREEIVEDYHGTSVADPYRWLENPATPESRAWTDEQNQLTRAFVDSPVRGQILSRLKEVCDYDRWSAPEKAGDHYFFWKHEGLKNQPVLYTTTRFTSEPKVLLNPNAFSKEGTVSVMSTTPSWDGNQLAYSLSHRGSDWQEIRIRDVKTGQDSHEVLMHTKFAGIAWNHENTGFYYNRYPDPGTVQDADLSYYNAVYWHELGTVQDDDILVYERPDDKDLDFWPTMTEDGQYLLLTVFLGTDRRNRIYYRPENSRAGFIRLLDQADAHYQFVGNEGDTFYFFTDHQAPHGRLVGIQLKKPDPEHWLEIIPEHEDILVNVTLAGNRFVAVYQHHAHHKLRIYDLEGTYQDDIPLPTLGAVSELNGRRYQNELFFGFTSFLFPTRTYSYQMQAHDLIDLHEHIQVAGFQAEDYVVHQEFATSPDGTRVPMFLVHRKDFTPTGETPVLMYGYGGFRQSLTPQFTATLLPWLEQGGIYCQVNTRGGFEYGVEWYKAGTLERKQNVFDDFISAGEWLIANNYTSPQKLAIRGGSNGGLLVGACMLQRPDLFGAVVCQVPVLDMLRYHRFTIGRYWVTDYGNAEARVEDFNFLYAYSPLHNVKGGVIYPPVLITSADHDDRVVPSHAKKFAATLQHASHGHNLVLLRVDTDAGHGRGKPLSKTLEEMSDIYAFLFKITGLSYSSQG
ncbi:S9 family peptidase [bacterium (Candidatus Blackallbacteria) CG17_big_fil_post_rev_8_21_14_2_50_48_46]|uniref:prolyl oligopeptidase n=1 Tax=bacterium (Candidatus Blackallbacteria) CG17_big_fil_post_rev_8_21_14_2_50_48_46 TaxID=2014261 RepID=A0A2M7G4W4_9BACT|nr:MAG: S9 family peptidase [bacterium (Candidatus Blackallbacteria) CG18_big_fil_WC_8_21_14_2_50_49_26]PIW16976.1 MAG: S9 family peptidase [bacterium (Candidatus Blackallbacteria) CG17_big_fil_post_rev_8_21_14_2_50_48_46]PIW50255.1 MAG: S9 family peptidase [bacterium (Candidatus Blackallbacteria) CG13_big_fil_rev_8_21_14_2_50_49_14]